MAETLTYIALAIFAYPYFWFHTFDPKLRMRVYFDGPDPLSEPDIFRAVPGAFSWIATFWTLSLLAPIVLPRVFYDIPELRCILDSNTILAIVAVVTVTKTIFLPGAVKHSSYQLGDDDSLHRNWRMWAIDAITVYPENVFTGLIIKLVVLPVVWALGWAISAMGLDFGTTTMVPGYVLVVWTFFYLGRVSQFFIWLKVKQNVVESGTTSEIYGEAIARAAKNQANFQPWKRKLIGLLLICSGCSVYIIVEKILQVCGGNPESLPSFALVIGAIVVIPLVDIGVSALGAAIDAVNNT